MKPSIVEYRVVWKRSGEGRKSKRYATIKGAEKFVAFLGPEPWTALGKDPDADSCDCHDPDRGCGSCGLTWRERLLNPRTRDEFPIPPIEYARIEQRPVGAWVATEAAKEIA